MSLPPFSVNDAHTLHFADLIAADLARDWAPLPDERKQALLNLGSRFLTDHFTFPASIIGTAETSGVVPEDVRRAQCMAALHAHRERILVEDKPQTKSIRAGRFGFTAEIARRSKVPADIVAAVGKHGRLLAPGRRRKVRIP